MFLIITLLFKEKPSKNTGSYQPKQSQYLKILLRFFFQSIHIKRAKIKVSLLDRPAYRIIDKKVINKNGCKEIICAIIRAKGF